MFAKTEHEDADADDEGLVPSAAGSKSAGVEAISLRTELRKPTNVVIAWDGSTFIAETFNHVIRRISLGGETTIFAGKCGHPGSCDGTGEQARFSSPTCLVFDSLRGLMVADSANDCLRVISEGGTVATFAGCVGEPGHVDGVGSVHEKNGKLRFNCPAGITTDERNRLYIADAGNNCVRVVTFHSKVPTDALRGVANIISSQESGAEWSFQVTTVMLREENEEVWPTALVMDAHSNVFIVDANSQHVVKVTAEGKVVGDFEDYGSHSSNNLMITSPASGGNGGDDVEDQDHDDGVGFVVDNSGLLNAVLGVDVVEDNECQDDGNTESEVAKDCNNTVSKKTEEDMLTLQKSLAPTKSPRVYMLDEIQPDTISSIAQGLYEDHLNKKDERSVARLKKRGIAVVGNDTRSLAQGTGSNTSLAEFLSSALRVVREGELAEEEWGESSEMGARKKRQRDLHAKSSDELDRASRFFSGRGHSNSSTELTAQSSGSLNGAAASSGGSKKISGGVETRGADAGASTSAVSGAGNRSLTISGNWSIGGISGDDFFANVFDDSTAPIQAVRQAPCRQQQQTRQHRPLKQQSQIYPPALPGVVGWSHQQHQQSQSQQQQLQAQCQDRQQLLSSNKVFVNLDFPRTNDFNENAIAALKSEEPPSKFQTNTCEI